MEQGTMMEQESIFVLCWPATDIDSPFDVNNRAFKPRHQARHVYVLITYLNGRSTNSAFPATDRTMTFRPRFAPNE
jgi:hypothetical protein